MRFTYSYRHRLATTVRTDVYRSITTLIDDYGPIETPHDADVIISQACTMIHHYAADMGSDMFALFPDNIPCIATIIADESSNGARLALIRHDIIPPTDFPHPTVKTVTTPPHKNK